ncbi:uncharacterized protein [Dysidea avara]|uniref:uncharacterized protein n=1 Tax=Dysidea avara TaxID=196820 RepID=UPI00331F94E5
MFITALAILLMFMHHTRSEVCLADQKYPACRCVNSDGKIIDLRSVGSKTKPRFDKITGGDYQYSYNPCYSFTEGDGACYKAAACQYLPDSNSYYSLGTQENAKFEYEGSNLKITYTGGTDDRTTVVKLKCDKTATTPELKYDEESPQKTYVLTMTSKCNCPGLCSGSSGSNHKSSSEPGIVGIVLLSVLVIVVIVYFVVGMIIMRVKYDKTGSDIIPNKTFWMSLPFLVKDGVLFTFTPCLKCMGRDKQGYSTMDKS